MKKVQSQRTKSIDYTPGHSGSVTWWCDTGCSCRVDAVGRVTQDELANSYKVHNLSNAKERRDHQGPAPGSLEERSGALLPQDFPMRERAPG